MCAGRRQDIQRNYNKHNGLNCDIQHDNQCEGRLNAIMLSVAFSYSYAEYFYAECSNAECRSTCRAILI